jgi:hypothetical protein
MTLHEASKLEDIIQDLNDVGLGLVGIVDNIDSYDRNQAASSIAFNAGIIAGLTEKLNRLKG